MQAMELLQELNGARNGKCSCQGSMRAARAVSSRLFSCGSRHHRQSRWQYELWRRQADAGTEGSCQPVSLKVKTLPLAARTAPASRQSRCNLAARTQHLCSDCLWRAAVRPAVFLSV